MRKILKRIFLIGVIAALAASPSYAQVADETQMAPVVDVVDENMTPVTGDELCDGVYDIEVDSSSSMFKITGCVLAVSEGRMSARMTMGGKGYLYIYPGSAEEAAAANEKDYISFGENADGSHYFVLPLEELDAGISCAAFSKSKELWYDRTLVFRAGSLPPEAFKETKFTSPESLALSDGVYLADVRLSGGSGRAKVESPARLFVTDGAVEAEIIFGSRNYDYMKVGEGTYYPLQEEGNSRFRIPVSGFDYDMPVIADTTAMSQPYEIAYTLFFDSASIREEEE